MRAGRFQAAAEHLGVEHACLGFYHQNTSPFIWTYPAQRAQLEAERYPLLCTIKLFTAALTAILASQHDFALTESSGELALYFRSPQAAPYGELTLAQLLAHTHGLADSALEQPDHMPWQQRSPGASLHPARLFEPGRFYSYGSVGYVLLGKLMAAVGRASFARLLETQLLAPMRGSAERCASDQDAPSTICPAASSGLTLALADLLSFCRLFTDPGRCVPTLGPGQVEELLQPRMTMPGWTPYMRASCFGFRDFGNGWYGHNGVDRRHLTYLRINPAEKAAICLLAGGDTGSIGALPALVLQDEYPELVLPAGKQPRVLHAKVVAPGHPLLGCYGDSRKVYCCLLKHGRLTLQVHERTGVPGSDLAVHECFLYPAEHDIYFLSRPWKKTVCVQLLAGSDCTSTYLWDQEQVLPARTSWVPQGLQ